MISITMSNVFPCQVVSTWQHEYMYNVAVLFIKYFSSFRQWWQEYILSAPITVVSRRQSGRYHIVVSTVVSVWLWKNLMLLLSAMGGYFNFIYCLLLNNLHCSCSLFHLNPVTDSITYSKFPFTPDTDIKLKKTPEEYLTNMMLWHAFTYIYYWSTSVTCLYRSSLDLTVNGFVAVYWS